MHSFFSYLEDRNMLESKLTDVEPKIIPTLMMAMKPEFEYLQAASYCLPVLYKDGRIPAFPPDCEIMATIMSHLLVVRLSSKSIRTERLGRGQAAGAAKGLSKSDLLFPRQTFSDDNVSPLSPRPGLFVHADKQHEMNLDKKEIDDSQLSPVASLTHNTTKRYLQFDLNDGTAVRLLTDLPRDFFPFPHEYDPNGNRSKIPHFWSKMEPDYEKMEVKVTFRDGVSCTYRYKRVHYDMYCGDMIDFLNKKTKNMAIPILRIHERNVPMGPRKVPYITCDASDGLQGDGRFQIKVTSSYQALADTGMENASSSIYSLIL